MPKKKKSLMDLDKAIQIALREVKDPNARAYLTAKPGSVHTGTEGLVMQLSCALFNMGKWKGKRAREVKRVMRRWVQVAQKRAGLK